MFRLFHRFLLGENIGPQVGWLHRQGAVVPRVVGMLAWSGQEFGPSTPGYWEALPSFFRLLHERQLWVEWVAFADAQIVMPDEEEQRAHLRRVLEVVAGFPNVFVEIANEPFKNGVDTHAIFSASDSRPCPMAFGDYEFLQNADGEWYLPGGPLDYLTVHTPRDDDAWSRKAKDCHDARQNTGVPTVSDEPMGAAEVAQPGARSANPDDHFWHHAVACLLSSGSTFHSDAGLQADVPQADSAQQRCADAVSLAWRSIPPEFQTGDYTRSGFDDLPLEWSEETFPPETSRIYGMILGNRSCCVAVKPEPAWRPLARDRWRIVSTIGPQDSLVMLERA
jgi:hypothetical protein